MISHIVLFEPKPGLTSDQIWCFAQQLRLVMTTATTVRRATVGKSVQIDTGEARQFGDQTYSFAAVVEFDDKQGLIDYLTHPAHRELGRLFWLYCAATVVMEVEAVDGKSDEVVELLVKAQN